MYACNFNQAAIVQLLLTTANKQLDINAVSQVSSVWSYLHYSITHTYLQDIDLIRQVAVLCTSQRSQAIRKL